MIKKKLIITFYILPQENGVLIESIDAHFDLARKKANVEIHSSRYGDLLFSVTKMM